MTTKSQKSLNVRFLHPRSGDVYDADVAPTATGNQVIAELRKADWLPDPGRGAFAMALKDATLDLEKPLTAQGVTEGASVQIILTNVGGGSAPPC